MTQNEKTKISWSLPNFITSLRILGTIGMCFVVPFSKVFFILFTLCGVSDVLDGWIARKTNTSSEFGAKLDSIADLLFYGVMLIKIFPTMWVVLPKKIWFFVAFVIVLRITSYSFVAIKYHRFSSLHTYMNKVTGAFMFAIPYFLTSVIGVIYCKLVCVVAILSSVEEFVIHLCSKTYRPENKTILKMVNNS